ncbi:MAG: ATP-binding protein, partial [Bacteroidota bacterium]
MADFVNWKEEITFFNNWFKSEPNALLFVYGPKSCGKSTLLLKLLEALDKKKFVANYLDLRGVLLYDFKSFLDTFFQKSNSDKLRGLIDGLSINTGFFTVGIEEE